MWEHICVQQSLGYWCHMCLRIFLSAKISHASVDGFLLEFRSRVLSEATEAIRLSPAARPTVTCGTSDCHLQHEWLSPAARMSLTGSKNVSFRLDILCAPDYLDILRATDTICLFWLGLEQLSLCQSSLVWLYTRTLMVRYITPRQPQQYYLFRLRNQKIHIYYL